MWGNRLSQLLYRASQVDVKSHHASPIPDASLSESESDVESEDNASGDGDPRGHVEDDESDSEESKGSPESLVPGGQMPAQNDYSAQCLATL